MTTATAFLLAAEDLEEAYAENPDAVTAFMTGKLRVEGDMGNAMQLQGVLAKLRGEGRPSGPGDRHAAVGIERAAGGEARHVGSKIERGLGNLFRPGDALHGVQPFDEG